MRGTSCSATWSAGTAARTARRGGRSTACRTWTRRSWSGTAREARQGPRPGPTVEGKAADAKGREAEAGNGALPARLDEEGRKRPGARCGGRRREDRPAWWEVYRLQDLDAEELERDGTAL